MATLTPPRRTSLPPGPDERPALQALRYHRDPLGFLRRAAAAHGPVFTLRMPAKDPMVVVACPEAVQQLLTSDPGRAHAGEARRNVLPLASPRSPFGADDAVHADVRARLLPWFEQDRMAGLAPAMADLAAEQAARWPVGRPFRLLPRMRTLATTVTVRLVLGVDHPVRSRALVAAIRRMLWTPGNPPVPVPDEADGAPGRVVATLFRRRLAAVRHLLPDDLDVDEWAVVLAAAQEPPAIALANVVLELAHHPAVQDAFVGDPARDHVVDEVLRLRPSASAALRRLTAPTTVRGHHLPVGTNVLLPSPLLHRDPEAFADPDDFRPERWATTDPATAPFLPFGGGARRCLGEALGRTELAVVVPTVLERLQFRPAWPRPERMVVRGTVLVPHRSALVTAARR